MRKKLAQYEGQNIRLTGVFIEISYVREKDEYIALIKPVKKDGYVVADHAWITIGDSFKLLELDKFDVIQFDAQVEAYKKHGDQIDYGLKDMDKVTILKKGDGYNYINKIQQFSFTVIAEQQIKLYGQSSKIVKQDLTKPLARGINLQVGDKVTCRFMKASNNRLIFQLRTDHMETGEWVNKIIFNPIHNNQSLSVRGYFNIYIPHDIYSDLKRAFFKVMCTKTPLIEAA